MGEELLAAGDISNGVEHLALAVAVCGQPHSLLSVLQQTLPPQVELHLISESSYDEPPYFSRIILRLLCYYWTYCIVYFFFPDIPTVAAKP